MKNNITEIIIAILLILISVLLLNPTGLWMPNMVVMGMLVIGFLLFAVFAGFLMREKIFDERDNTHRALAGRNAFLAGAGLLMLSILIEGYSHHVDKWLVFALVAMIVTKILTRIWSDRNM